MYAYGRHLWREDVDTNCLTNDCTIGARFVVDNGVTKDCSKFFSQMLNQIPIGNMSFKVI